MAQVEQVALWTGLMAGVVGIVLAVVAISFTWVVDRRSQQINTQMIQSLQKIESTVEGVSSDTASLIKVAWDRMLPGAAEPSAAPATDDESVRAIAAGVAAELRAELASEDGEGQQSPVQRLDETVRLLEQTMRAQLRNSTTATSSGQFARLYKALDQGPPASRELVRFLHRHGHLERQQYHFLRNTDLGDSLAYLRQQGILVALKGESKPVYWLSPTIQRQLIQAVLSLIDADPSAAELVESRLDQAGYFAAGG